MGVITRAMGDLWEDKRARNAKPWKVKTRVGILSFADEATARHYADIIQDIEDKRKPLRLCPMCAKWKLEYLGVTYKCQACRWRSDGLQ